MRTIQPRRDCSILRVLNKVTAMMMLAAGFGALLGPPASAQTPTPVMKFGFEDTGTTTVDSISGVVLNITNAAGAQADLHGAGGTGVAGVGKALDFTSSPANNTAACIAATLGSGAINFGTVSNFTMTMWIKSAGAANSLNFGRFFCVGASTVTDNGQAGSLGFQGNGGSSPYSSVQVNINNVNPGAIGGLSNMVLNTWTFLAYTYDGSVTARVYTATETQPVVSGGYASNSSFAPIAIGSTFNTWIGNRPGSRTRGFPAYIDDVRLYTNTLDAAALEKVRLEAIPDPYVLGTTITPGTAVAGAPVTISAAVSGTQPITYTWQFVNGSSVTNLIPAAGPTYSIPSVALSDAGTYSLIVSNNPGGVPKVVTNTPATLVVRAAADTLAWLGTANYNWDTTTANWSNTVTTTAGVPYQGGDNVQFTDAGKTNTVTLTTALFPSSVVVSSANNYTFAGSGSLGGVMSLTKTGTGILSNNTANSFSGTVAINGGVLRAGNGAALGTTNGNTVVASGATYDVGGQSVGLEEIVVQGNGANGTNAIQNSGGQQQSAISRLVLNGPTTISSGANRWDVYGGGGLGYLRGNHNSLTKYGSQDIWLKDVGDTGLGNLQINQGVLGFQGYIGMGDPNATVTVINGGLGFWAATNFFTLSKVLVMTNSILNSGGFTVGTFATEFHGPITLSGTNTFNVNSDLHLYSTISGSDGGLIKNGAGTLTLDGANTYPGSTLITAGSVVLGSGSTLDASSVIRLSPGATLDASLTANFGLARSSGQSLLGAGASANPAIVLGNVTNAAGSTLAPGVNGPGTLNIGGSLALKGITLPINLGNDPAQLGNGVNDYLQVNGELALSGVNTIQITPVGPLSAANYIIATYASLSGGAANLAVSSSNPRYSFSVVDPATTPGTIQLSVTGNPTPLVWKGGKAPGPNIWNHTVTNFLNTGTSLFDRFYNGDLVTFDDTAATNIINVTETNIPGLMLLANNAASYTFYGAGNIGGTLAHEGSGIATIALSNSPVLAFITNNLGILAFSPPVDQTVSAPVYDNMLGQGTVLKTGTNILTLTGDNSQYYGAIAATNGTLRYGAATALGAGLICATNGGTLDINNVDTGTKNISIAGMGFNAQGALGQLTTTWPAWPYEIVHNLTLVGDAAIGSNARWDLNGGSLAGNVYKLTKVGAGQIVLKTIGETGLGDIDITAGNLTFQDTATMGDPTKTLTVRSNAVLAFWAGAAPYDKKIVLQDGAIDSGGASNTVAGVVTLSGQNRITGGSDLLLAGTIGGTGGLTKASATALWLAGANTYSGSTIVGGNGTVRVGAGSSLGSSSVIEIDGGSTLDVTAATPFTVGSGQTMIGNGTVNAENLSVAGGATLSPSFSTYTATLTVRGNLTLQSGSTNVFKYNKTTGLAADRVAGLTSVNYGGTLVVNALAGSGALAGGDALVLFSATNYSGSFASIIPSAPGPGTVWDTSTLLTDGTLRVLSTVNLAPTNIVYGVSGSTLTLSWPADHTGWSLMAQTNNLSGGVSTNASDWGKVAASSTTNRVDIPINMNTAAAFYRLVYP